MCFEANFSLSEKINEGFRVLLRIHRIDLCWRVGEGSENEASHGRVVNVKMLPILPILTFCLGKALSQMEDSIKLWCF